MTDKSLDVGSGESEEGEEEADGEEDEKEGASEEDS